MSLKPKNNSRERLFHLILFAMLGALMYISKWALQWAANIHLIGFFIMVFTFVYRSKALIPTYIFVFLCGALDGFGMWWYGYLYVWAVLWGVTMLLPADIVQRPCGGVVCAAVNGLFGLLFDILFLPASIFYFNLYSRERVLLYLAGGTWFNILHCVGNIAAGLLVPYGVRILKRLEKSKG